MQASFLRLPVLGLCLATFTLTSGLRADDTTTPPPPPPGKHGPHLPPGFNKLNLTDAQKADIQKILKDSQEEMRRKIDAVLTADQKAQLEKMRAEHEKNGDGGNPPPPPPQ